MINLKELEYVNKYFLSHQDHHTAKSMALNTDTDQTVIDLFHEDGNEENTKSYIGSLYEHEGNWYYSVYTCLNSGSYYNPPVWDDIECKTPYKDYKDALMGFLVNEIQTDLDSTLQGFEMDLIDN